jgi:hypothetical protein
MLDEALRLAHEGVKILANQPAILRARSTGLMFADRLDEALRDIDVVSHGRSDLGLQDLWVMASVDLKRGYRDQAARRFSDIIHRYPQTIWEL